jgi:hypothetical protein
VPDATSLSAVELCARVRELTGLDYDLHIADELTT